MKQYGMSGNFGYPYEINAIGFRFFVGLNNFRNRLKKAENIINEILKKEDITWEDLEKLASTEAYFYESKKANPGFAPSTY